MIKIYKYLTLFEEIQYVLNPKFSSQKKGYITIETCSNMFTNEELL